MAARGAPRDLVGVFTDIDDTLTTEGAITPDALQALADLQGRRPARAWRSPAARWAGASPSRASGRSMRSWPRTARSRCVPSARRGALDKRYQQDAATRARQLRAHAARAGRASSAKCPARAAPPTRRAARRDIAIDHSEFTHLDDAQIAAVVALMQQRRHARHRQQHPRQRLVRRAQQARRRPLDRARAVGPRARRRDGRAGPTSATRPTTR